MRSFSFTPILPETANHIGPLVMDDEFIDLITKDYNQTRLPGQVPELTNPYECDPVYLRPQFIEDLLSQHPSKIQDRYDRSVNKFFAKADDAQSVYRKIGEAQTQRVFETLTDSKLRIPSIFIANPELYTFSNWILDFSDLTQKWSFEQLVLFQNHTDKISVDQLFHPYVLTFLLQDKDSGQGKKLHYGLMFPTHVGAILIAYFFRWRPSQRKFQDGEVLTREDWSEFIAPYALSANPDLVRLVSGSSYSHRWSWGDDKTSVYGVELSASEMAWVNDSVNNYCGDGGLTGLLNRLYRGQSNPHKR